MKSVIYAETGTLPPQLAARRGVDVLPFSAGAALPNAGLVVLGNGHIPAIDALSPSVPVVQFSSDASQLHSKEIHGRHVVTIPSSWRENDMLGDLLAAIVQQSDMERKLLLLQMELAEKKELILEINQMGVALGSIKDYGKFHQYLLSNLKKILKADGASLYIVDPEDANNLIFVYLQSYSRDLPFKSKKIAINAQSIAGYTAQTKAIVNIPDAYYLPPDSPFKFDPSFDKMINYRTKSILGIPMMNHKNELLGVIQLINKKQAFDVKLETPEFIEGHVTTFGESDETLALSLANLAGISLENNQLYTNIEQLLEKFIHASASAIDQRDPVTSGHSQRVAMYTMALAVAQNKMAETEGRGTLSEQQLKELYFSGLLHDFGKIGVREHVLTKAKKLYDPDLKVLEARYSCILDKLELQFLRDKLSVVTENGGDTADARIFAKEEAYRSEKVYVERMLAVVREANEPNFLKKELADALVEAKGRMFSFDGVDYPLLTDKEFDFLSVEKGSLNKEERLEIESHVSHSYAFLKQIPWTKELSKLALIAWGHHELLDGTGYPRKIKGDEILFETKMMTIADIFDALTAWDRPYKKAMPLDKALDILKGDAERGKLDPELLRIFIDSKVWALKDSYQEQNFQSLLQFGKGE